MLANGAGPGFESVIVADPREALLRLGREPYDAAIVDAAMLEPGPLASVAVLCERCPELAVLVLSARTDVEVAARALRDGAQDVLFRASLTPTRLRWALNFAVERARRQAELVQLSLTDPLTGLCNRRGFLLLAEAHVRLLRRTHRQSMLLYADVDNLKEINDRLGHAAGDQALVACAHALHGSLRDSDLVARYGGDEFLAIALDVVPGAALALLPRIAVRLERASVDLGLTTPLRMSVGTASLERGKLTLDEILERADRALYGAKRHPECDVSVSGPGGPHSDSPLTA
jgi:diguanylate cyclase (GGDEF)-like protein